MASVDSMKAQLCANLDKVLKELHSIWIEIGIVSDQREERTTAVMQHLSELLDEMVNEEKNLKQRLLDSVTSCKEELGTLSEELAMSVNLPESNLSLLYLEKELRTQLDVLKKEKHERIKQLKRLRDKDQAVCDAISTTPYYIPTGMVPSQDQLIALEEHIREMENEKQKRMETFLDAKEKIAKLLEDMEGSPDTTFSRDVLCESEDGFILSSENMQTLQDYYIEVEEKHERQLMLSDGLREKIVSLWNRLDVDEDHRNDFLERHMGIKPHMIDGLERELARLQVLKQQNIQTFVEQLREELQEWWEKCFISSERRTAFEDYFSDDFSEELLESHESEVQKLKDYYEANRFLLEGVIKWKNLWNKMIEFEARAKDPNRYNNRGGNLLKEEKERKKVCRDLPTLESELREKISIWEAQKGRSFLVGGQRFVDYVESQYEEHQQQIEKEKMERQRAKEASLKKEIVFGCKPVTPSKRRMPQTTPSKTPKQRKLNGAGTRTESTTPGGSQLSSRTASRTVLGHTIGNTMFHSPVQRPPKSATKLKSSSQTPHVNSPTTKNFGPRLDVPNTRKVLGDRNDTLFSHTHISGSSVAPSNDISAASTVASYAEFSKEMNRQDRENYRSSVIHKF